jgi:hypothetical protein
MHIRNDWAITLDGEQFIGVQGESFAKLLKNPRQLAIFREALDQVVQVIEPQVCWDRFPIKGVLHERLVLADGTKIGGGPVVSVVRGADELVVAVCTIGPGADSAMVAARNDKQLFKAMMLHDLSAWAVDLLRQEFCRWLEEDLARQGLRTSAPLSPGESVWSVKDQEVIFSLLDAGRIGVSLTKSMLMHPSRSLSLIMGTGAHPMGVEGVDNCDFCTIQERCNYRHKRATIQPALA